eukprot:3715280-Rhodomonas_salina.3
MSYQWPTVRPPVNERANAFVRRRACWTPVNRREVTEAVVQGAKVANAIPSIPHLNSPTISIERLLASMSTLTVPFTSADVRG